MRQKTTSRIHTSYTRMCERVSAQIVGAHILTVFDEKKKRKAYNSYNMMTHNSSEFSVIPSKIKRTKRKNKHETNSRKISFFLNHTKIAHEQPQKLETLEVNSYKLDLFLDNQLDISIFNGSSLQMYTHTNTVKILFKMSLNSIERFNMFSLLFSLFG